MSCTDQFLVINNIGNVTQVYPTNCVQISGKVKGFSDGTTTSNPFSDTFDQIKIIDFSTATNLETIGSYTFYNCSKVKIFDSEARFSQEMMRNHWPNNKDQAGQPHPSTPKEK